MLESSPPKMALPVRRSDLIACELATCLQGLSYPLDCFPVLIDEPSCVLHGVNRVITAEVASNLRCADGIETEGKGIRAMFEVYSRIR
jgi:hypothetical protein